jgi:hypothetical protein
LFQRVDVDRQRVNLIGAETDRRHFMTMADGQARNRPMLAVVACLANLG